ncbi:hypothetical protein H6G76_09650 [Nostoc sp. FACHB-152]|uniref:glycosyltransferase family 39 protein n=1 Tax=unclassified Nostoc TaxID=2593658 RepID=UPI0016889F18|nr:MULTISPECIES: hypothetical protein [unclassified Nostoc]MBD2447429.1 hypothetical protein [Nostoc sp. FACHB-152]MBD2468239.1 hypothetical protein [Nostoc sp. FACHB-145]
MEFIRKYKSNYNFVLHLFFLIVLLLGIFFRFTNLDHKVYWYDEAMSSLRASGYTEQEVVQHFSQRSIVSVTELQRYQHPDGTRNIINTFQGAAKENQKYSPIYYSMANIWFHTIGSSVALARLLPAFLSLLAFPCIYWLCQELFVERGIFASKLPTWIMIGLIAVSPFHVLYAQESRHYSLWTVTTLMSTAALLRAIRLNTIISWIIYAITLGIHLNTFLLAGLVAIAHGIYVLLMYRFYHIRILKAYLGASLVGVTAFLPWAWIVITNISHVNTVVSWTSSNTIENAELRDRWIMHIGRLFFDVNQDPWDFYVHRLLLVLTVYAFYRLCRQTPLSVWLLIFLLTAVSTLPLIIPDLISGGVRSTRARYMIPGLLTVQLAITYLLGINLASPSLKSWHEKFWRLVLVMIFLGSVLSCVVSSQATVWYNKDINKEHIAITQIINQTKNPLLISDASVGYLLSLSHSLNPNVQILIKPNYCDTCVIQSSRKFSLQIPIVEELVRFSDVFVYFPGKSWREKLTKQQNYKFEPIVFSLSQSSKKQPVLWRVMPIQKSSVN